MNTQVVNLNKEPYDVYIGRRNRWKKLPDSFWRNPYSVEEHGREEAIRLYEQFILSSPEHLGRLHELKGKKLGCWCKPQACHGDILTKLIELH
jgi:hypothetical protein